MKYISIFNVLKKGVEKRSGYRRANGLLVYHHWVVTSPPPSCRMSCSWRTAISRNEFTPASLRRWFACISSCRSCTVKTMSALWHSHTIHNMIDRLLALFTLSAAFATINEHWNAPEIFHWLRWWQSREVPCSHLQSPLAFLEIVARRLVNIRLISHEPPNYWSEPRKAQINK